jgi:hypothetical protein
MLNLIYEIHFLNYIHYPKDLYTPTNDKNGLRNQKSAKDCLKLCNFGIKQTR